jgi:hypothetical protein
MSIWEDKEEEKMPKRERKETHTTLEKNEVEKE